MHAISLLIQLYTSIPQSLGVDRDCKESQVSILANCLCYLQDNVSNNKQVVYNTICSTSINIPMIFCNIH